MAAEFVSDMVKEVQYWLDNVDMESSLKFITAKEIESIDNTMLVVEALGYHSFIDQLIAEEIRKSSTKIRKVAGIYSDYLSEMIQIENNEILLPVSILECELKNGKKILFVTTNFAIPDIISYSLSEKLHSWYLKNNLSKVIIIDGVHTFDEDDDLTVYHFKINNRQISPFEDKKINFNIVGPSASSLVTYLYHNDITVEAFLVKSSEDYDPRAALEILKALTTIDEFKGLENYFNDLKTKVDEFNKLTTDNSPTEVFDKAPFFV